MSAKIQGQVISFYSYKGGTGRTMALANVAMLLAKKNHKVLMIDWDLEAPSLHYFFGKREPFNQPGLIDLFENIKARFETNQELMLEKNSSLLFEAIGIDKYIYEIEENRLFLITAGTLNSDYAHQVTSFRWVDFFDQIPWFFRIFALFLSEKYDYILIDSRTGLNDISGICTALMPDKLVAVFTPNNQSISGLLGMVSNAVKYRGGSDDLRAISVFPLPSRVELQEKELLDGWRFGNKKLGLKGYQEKIEDLLKELYGLNVCKLNNYLDAVQIQQQTYYAYGENIAVLDEQGSGRLSLKESYEEFEKRLINTVAPWMDPESPIEDKKLETITETSPQDKEMPIKKSPKVKKKSIETLPRVKDVPIEASQHLPYKYDAFISYNSSDREIALELARKLTDSGLSIWFDAWRLIPGKPWQEALETALKSSKSIVLLIGDSGLGKWENEEMRYAIDSQLTNPNPMRTIIPALVPGSDPQLLREERFLNRFTWIDMRSGLDDNNIFKLVSGIKQQEPGETKTFQTDTFVPFVDREDEIDSILARSSAQYHLIHGPSGYGKSRLLRQLDIMFEEKGWDHAYVSTSKDGTLAEIAEAISKKLNISLSQLNDVRPGLKLGTALTNYYSGLSRSSPIKLGLILLIDLDKEPSHDLFGILLEEFIPDVQRTINNLRQFENEDLQFRVVISGRNLAITKEAKSTNLPLDQRALTPFTYEAVKKAIDLEFFTLVNNARGTLAAHIIYMTGGHPAGMARIFLLYRRTPISIDEFIETCEQEIQHNISITVDEIKDSLPKGDFIKAFESLTVFRIVNYHILDVVRNKYQLAMGDTFDFEDVLTKNHLFSRKQPYTLQDEVARRLISTYLRHFQPDVYLEYCSVARQLCQEILRSDDVRSPTEWTLEFLFQWLQEQSLDSIQSSERRKNLRSNFLAHAVPVAIDLYTSRYVRSSRNKMREDYLALINELHQERQWEFEFAVNYYLREDVYDDSPYRELERRINELFDNKIKEVEA